MDQVTRQLETVRSLGRLMLAAQRLMQGAAAVLTAALVLGFTDYLLRLPGWIRLLIGVAAAVVAFGWFSTRFVRALRFRPELSALAQRAEKLFPHLSGVLASTVEFSLHADQYASPHLTRELAATSIADAQRKLAGINLVRMIEPAWTYRAMALFLLAALVVGGVIVAAPTHSALAVRRWLAPLGDAAWPRRTQITTAVADTVWPSDSPIRMRATIDRGYRSNMRAWVSYRLIDANGNAGEWRSELLNEQMETAHHAFERLIDLPAMLTGAAAANPGVIQYRFIAGDDETTVSQVQLVTRPAVMAVAVDIEPPAYAQGLVAPQSITLNQSGGIAGLVATASALQGSTVRMTLRLNKPLPSSAMRIDRLLPGLSAGDDVQLNAAADRREIAIAFNLTQTVQSPIHLTDEFGLESLSERQYRIEAVEDKPPAATLIDPANDESVLATAVLPVRAIAQDDVGIERVSLETTVNAQTSTLREAAGRQSRLEVAHELALAGYALKAGDEVLLEAVTRDVFDLNSVRHDPVRSKPRKLRIIDEAALISQIRAELAGVRQQAVRLETQQRELVEQPAREAQPRQEQMTGRLTAQEALMQRLVERIARNRLTEPRIDELVGRAGELLKDAARQSQSAAAKLDQALQQPERAEAHRQDAGASQQAVMKALGELSQMLDQGRDALALQLQLKALAGEQRELAAASREMLPRTLGRDAEQLSDAEREQLRQLADRQAGLAEQSRQLTEQMRQTAEALSKEGATPEDTASAQSLAEAAAIAQRQGLTQTMKQASDAARQNRLSEAGQQQDSSQSTLQDMLDQLGKQDQRRQEILQRRLAKLGESIEKLIARQTEELERLKQADGLVGLDEPMSLLRRNTLSVEEEARAMRQTEAAGVDLGAAAERQGVAIRSLRERERQPSVDAEAVALEKLKDALEKVNATNEAARQEQARQQREQMRARYTQLALEQRTLREQTERFSGLKELTRQQRREMVDLGNREADLRIAAAELKEGEHVSRTLMFQHLHGRIDELADQAVRDLRSAKADAPVAAQSRIESMFMQMAEALKESPTEEPFASGQSGDGGGGGGGGGAGNRPAIPREAELKLFAGLQRDVYERTREIADARDRADAAAVKRLLLQLSVEQRQLAGLGAKLMQDAMRRPAAATVPVEPKPEEPSP